MLTFDHLVISAEELEQGVEYTEQALGVKMSPGGRHEFMGTHNALLSLGPGAYLEVIAIDPDAKPPAGPRWFGLDDFRGPPRLTNWVCRTVDFDAALAASPPELGRKMAASRGTFEWLMAIPEAGQYPFGGAFPGVISWLAGGHPTDNLPDHGLRLEMLEICTPNAEKLSCYTGHMFETDKLQFRQSTETRLSAQLFGPRDRLRLT